MKHLIGRHLQSELCAGPTANATVTLEGFADAAAVEEVLAEILSGEADVPVDETTSASDTICTADARLMMVPPSTDVLDDGAKPNAGEGDKKPSKLASIVIGVVVAAVGVMLILAVTIMVLKRRRNLAVSPN